MRANRKISLLLCIFSLIFFCIGCGEGKFNGSMVGNENEFSLEYSVFNTTYEHNFNLEKETLFGVVLWRIKEVLTLVFIKVRM